MSRETVMAEMRRIARVRAVSTTTVGVWVGQGGKFYKELEAGRRMYPETCQSVLSRLSKIDAPSDVSTDASMKPDSLACDNQHRNASGAVQPQGAK